MHNHSGLLKVVFVTGYASGAVAAYYACYLLWPHARARLRTGQIPRVDRGAAEAGAGLRRARRRSRRTCPRGYLPAGG